MSLGVGSQWFEYHHLLTRSIPRTVVARKPGPKFSVRADLLVKTFGPPALSTTRTSLGPGGGGGGG